MEILKISEFNWLTKFGILKLDEITNKYVNQEIRKNFWVQNNLSTNCFICDVKFSTFIIRQHHCRICGNIFCNNCTSKQIHILNKNKLIKLRICNYCFNICKNFSSYIEKRFIKEEIKENYYYNNYEKSNINNNKFENLKIEKDIKDYINNIFEIILKNLIKNVLDEYFSKGIVEEWENILFILIKDAISNLRTNPLFLNDSFNINKYIKIKLIPYKDNSESKVIPGFVMKKRILSKNLKTSFIGPRILLINLENDLTTKKLDNFSNSFQRSNAYIKIIEKKLQILNPDIILIGKYYPKLLYNNLINNTKINNKCCIFDVKKKSFENIARSTQNVILPSFNLLGTNNILGNCKNFYIKKINYNFKFQREIKTPNKIENGINKDEIYLIVFEGSDPLLFNTIILSGEDKLFLKKIKNLLKNILLPTARDLFLQKYLLYIFNVKFDQEKNFNEKEIYSIFEENKNIRPKELIQEPITMKDYDLKNSAIIKNNNNLKDFNLRKTFKIVNRLLNKEKKIERKLSKKIKNNNIDSNSYYKGFDLSIICKKSEYINYSLIRISRTTINKDNNLIIEENNFDTFDDDEDEINYSFASKRSTINTIEHPIREKIVQKNIGKYCKRPSKFFLSFYSDNKFYDKPLGQFIFDLCKESQKNCDICGIQLSKHINYLYKYNGRIIAKLISEKENLLEAIINYLRGNYNFTINHKISDNILFFDIYTYGYCKICQDIVTPLFKLPNEVLNYSTAKFLKFLFENLNNENNIREYDYNIKNLINHNKCKHYINKDISRIFVTQYGSWLFEYDSISKYYISPLNINQRLDEMDKDKNNKTNENINDDIEEYRREVDFNSKTILDMIYNYFQKQISGLEKLLNDE